MNRPDGPVTPWNLLHTGRAAVIAVCMSVVLNLTGCSWLRKQQGRESEVCRSRIEASFTAQQAGDLKKARQLLDSATEVQPQNAETWWNLAELSIQQDDYPSAISELKKYVELKPTDPQGYLRLAQLYYLQNQYTQVGEMLAEVIRRSPNNFEAVMLSARLHRKQADHQKAIACYYHALQIAPQHLDATLELSELLISKHESARAASLLRELTRKSLEDEDMARVSMNLGIAYGQVQRWDDAVEHLETAHALTSDPQARDRYRLAYAHWKAGGSQQALKYLIEMADSGTWNPRADALYATITETSIIADAQEQILPAGFERKTAEVAPPFPVHAGHDPLFLPDRLITGPVSSEMIVPPEWVELE